MHNYEIAEYFSLLSKLMEIHGENPFKIKSYSNAAFTLDKLNDPVIDMEPHQLFSIRGIGEAIGQKVLEIIDSKRLSLLDSYIEKTPTGVFEFLKIKGLGPKKLLLFGRNWKLKVLENYFMHAKKIG
jgi:DNA polymerase (family 10)